MIRERGDRVNKKKKRRKKNKKNREENIGKRWRIKAFAFTRVKGTNGELMKKKRRKKNKRKESE